VKERNLFRLPGEENRDNRPPKVNSKARDPIRGKMRFPAPQSEGPIEKKSLVKTVRSEMKPFIGQTVKRKVKGGNRPER